MLPRLQPVTRRPASPACSLNPHLPVQVIAQSEGDADDELLSVAVVKDGKKVGGRVGGLC